MLSVAAGVLVIAGGTAGLLSTHGTAAQPPTVPTPTTSIVQLPTAHPTTGVSPGVLQPSYAAPEPSGAVGSVPAPLELLIPKIGVTAKIIDLGLTTRPSPDLPIGSLDTKPLDGQPEALDEVGWYTGSAMPGAIGPAVIAGHIDWDGPGVFMNLHELHRGEYVYVKRKDGSTVKFRVTKVQTTLKNDFPTGGVFGQTPDAELRLISCTGTLQTSGPLAGHYNENVIVYAVEA